MSSAAVLDRPVTTPAFASDNELSDHRRSACVTFDPTTTGKFTLLFSCLAGRTETGEPVQLTPSEDLELIRAIQGVVNDFCLANLGLLPISRPFWVERPCGERDRIQGATRRFCAKIGDTFSTGRTEIVDALLKAFEVEEITMTVLWPENVAAAH